MNCNWLPGWRFAFLQEVSLVLALETGRPAKTLMPPRPRASPMADGEGGLFFSYYLILVLRFVVDREDAVPAENEKKKKRKGKRN